MKRSSSPSEQAGSRLFSSVFSRGDVAREVSDRAWLQAMLDFESGLARALARAGLAPVGVADAITRTARAENFDVDSLGAESARTGNPVVAMLHALTSLLPKEASGTVHLGATSQDVIDTAMMLLAKRAAPTVIRDVRSAADAAAALATQHRSTVMLGRTLLQQALPITFGLKAATWLTALEEASARLDQVVRARLGVQFGGAAGTLVPLGGRGLEVAGLLADELGLVLPVLPWHTFRLPILELAGALAGVSSVLGKIARDVTLLSQSEVAEVAEPSGPGRGASSAMPHKQNPVAAISILGCTRRVPGLLANLLAASEQEHERAAGAWHAEWETLTDLLRLTGSAAAWARELLSTLRVDGDRMRKNLEDARMDSEIQLGSSEAWIDRSLLLHRARREATT